MRKDDLVLLKEYSQGNADYTRAQAGGYVCCIVSVSGDDAQVRIPVKPDNGNTITSILYTKTVTIPKDKLELIEGVFDNVRRKT